MKSNKSKYKSTVDHVIDGINERRLKKGAWIPSLNEFREMYGLSRDTVFFGIRELKSRGTIESNPGVGYYIVSTHVPFKHNTFLLFNESNELREDVYNSFMGTVGNSATADFYFHNYNRKVFEILVNDADHKYTTYTTMSSKSTDIGLLLEGSPGNVLLLDHYHSELKGKYSSVFQNFEEDTYEALAYGLSNLRKYGHIVMVQRDSKEPFKRYDGLWASCKEHSFTHERIGEIRGRETIKQEVFIIVNNRDLVNLLKWADRQQLVSGKDFGIISYNDTPLKEVLVGGITTLSINFKLTGCTIAFLISKRTIETIENPRNLNIRNSL